MWSGRGITVLYCTGVSPGTRYSCREPMTATDERAGARWSTALVDLAQLFGLALSVPVAILLVGAPVALALALLLWLARMVLGSS